MAVLRFGTLGDREKEIAALVLEMRERRGLSFAAIARELREWGYTNRAGRPITVGSVQRILSPITRYTVDAAG